MTSVDLTGAKRELVQRILRGQVSANLSSRLEDLGFARTQGALQHDAKSRYDKFPLTEMQQAYWVGRHKTLEMGNVAIHSYLEVHTEALEVERLERAWNSTVRRHDMLRAVIRSDGHQQVLADPGPYKIREEIYATADECRAARQRAREQMSHEVFNTEEWPLFRLMVTRGRESGVVLHVSVDGVLLDAWSLSIVIRECLELYESPERYYPELAITFRDYVMADLAARSGDAYQKSMDWWRRKLETLPAAPDLPLMKRPHALRNPRFMRRSGGLAEERWKSLRQKAGHEGVTPPCLLLALYAEVLAAWTATRKFTLNVPRFERRPVHPQVDDLVGEFASFTLVDCDLSSPATLRERANAMQRQMWDVLEHGDVSGVTVVRELIRLRGRGAAVFPVVFTANPSLGVHRPPAAQTSFGGQVVHAITQTSQVWLDFQVGEQDGALSFNWDGVDELFPPNMTEQANATFCGLLEAISSDDSCWDRPLQIA